MSIASNLVLFWLLCGSCGAAPPKELPVASLNCRGQHCEDLNYPNASEVAYFTEEIARQLEGQTSLILRNSQLNQLPLNVFRTLAGLEHLDVQGCHVQHVAGRCFEGAAKLKTLQLAGNSIAKLEAGSFELAPELEQLNLADNQLDELSAQAFAGLHRLRQLGLEGNRLHQLPAGIFSQLQQLQQLNLDNNRLSELPDALCAAQPQLQLFSARGNQLKRIAANAFAYVEHLRISDNAQLEEVHLAGRIRQLEADNCPLRRLRLDQVERLEQLLLRNTKLQSLSFLRNATSLLDLDLTGLAELPAMPDPWPAQQLKRLSISHANGSNWPDQILKQLPELKLLDVWRNREREIYIKEDFFGQPNGDYIDARASICAQLVQFVGDETQVKQITIFDNGVDNEEAVARPCPGIEPDQGEQFFFYDDDRSDR